MTFAERRNRWKFAFNVLLHGPPEPEQVALGLQARTWVPRQDAWNHPEHCHTRQVAALSVMDPDVCGFFLVTFRADTDLHVSHVLDRDWWPFVADAVDRVRVG